MSDIRLYGAHNAPIWDKTKIFMVNKYNLPPQMKILNTVIP